MTAPTARPSVRSATILVLGAGVAGLSSALAAVRDGHRVVLVTPGALGSAVDATGSGGSAGPAGSAGGRSLQALGGGNTALAQGGIAAAIGAADSAADHCADTLAAGAGLVDPAAADVLTAEGVRAVRGLLAAGLAVDRDPSGAPSLGLEAAHRRPRIVHAGGDRTGAILHAFLTAQVRAAMGTAEVTLREQCTATALLMSDGVAAGALLRGADGALEQVRADAVILATGGYAGLYPRTSNHAGARGEGIVLAAGVGAAIADLEFVQFHPTVLAGTGELISEAVRGDGAVLRDGSGRRFMRDRHPLAELAPRDVVAREIHRVLRERGEASVWLDATGIERAGGPGTLARHFPGISAAVARHGLDWSRDPIPVSPAAHYSMGGVVSDLDGRTTVPGLFAVGEVASTGVHGANRLASNSLLEGLVFGARAGRVAGRDAGADWTVRGEAARRLSRVALDAEVAQTGHVAGASRAGAAEVAVSEAAVSAAVLSDSAVSELAGSEAAVSEALAAGLGIERDADGLRAAGRVFARASGSAAAVAQMIRVSAEARTESRGAHQRSDHPAVDPLQDDRRAFRFTVKNTPEAAAAADSQLLRSLSPC